MIQIFLKKSEIKSKDWERAYQKIESIIRDFPLKLIRVESYNGFSPELNKEHFNLQLGAGTPEEHISFYGDRMSFTSGTTVRFYKNWEKEIEHELSGKEFRNEKPITWSPPEKYKNDGSLPEANGSAMGGYGYIDTRGALYEYAILAIGVMLENLLEGNVFLTAIERNKSTIENVVGWLRGHFQEDFKLPIYFDKPRLLASFINEYKVKKDAVGRMEQLYHKQFKSNMEFALSLIGYKPTFEYYSEALADNYFGTFGFSDVLNPWIMVTKDLEKTLQLIDESKRLLLEKKEDQQSLEKAKKYDLTDTLKSWLDDFILWTPQQREQLEHFYTNQQALETGQEDLFGNIMRMSGYRVDICPMYATKKELFEAFMYHDPKNGDTYKQIIEGWIDKNEEAYENLKKKLEEEVEKRMVKQLPSDTDSTIEKELRHVTLTKNFIERYPEHEYFFITSALEINPNLLCMEEALENMHISLWNLCQNKEHQRYVQSIQVASKEERIQYIRHRLKDLRLSVNPCFEEWLREEEDCGVMFFLRLLMSLKIYDRDRAFARHIMLWDRKNWEHWRMGQKYAM